MSKNINNLIIENNIEEVKKLLNKNKRIYISNKTYLIACKKNSYKMIQLLLDFEGFQEPLGYSYTEAVVIRSKLETIKVLIEHPKSSSNFFSHFYKACVYGKLNVIKFLLNFDNKQLTSQNSIKIPIVAAYKNGYTNIVELLWGYEEIREELKKQNANIFKELSTKHFQEKIKKF